MDPSETFSDIRHLCTKINKSWTLSIQGCYFHFAQAIYRQVGHLGYAMDYRNDAAFREAIRSIIALGHVPIHLKDHYYQGFIRAYGADPRISRLCQVYFYPTWFCGSFSAATWTWFNSQTRTNNMWNPSTAPSKSSSRLPT